MKVNSVVEGLVTIVLPIYNVGKYLDRCMESVVNQTYKNIEIIMVDDGSTDDCPEICEKWRQKDERIKVIHKKNAGLGMARNTGIENATGEYICFFDSDDYIAIDTIEKVYQCVCDNKAELVIFGFSTVDTNGKIKKCIVPKTKKNLYKNQDVINCVLPDLIAPDPKTGEKTNLWMSAWACMYSMKAIQRANWRFVSERQYISEDVYSLLFLYKELKSVAVLSEALYFYCENGTSLTHVYRKDRYEKNKYCYEACQKACDLLGYNQDIKDRLAFQYMSNMIGAFKLIVTSDCSKKEQRQYLSEIIKDKHFQKVVHNMDIHKETLNRKILFIAIRQRCVWVVYELVKLKS